MKQRLGMPFSPFSDLAQDFPVAHHHVHELPETFPEEAYLLLPYTERRAIERRLRVRRINGFLKEGRDTLTFDLGCMAGQTTTSLQLATRGKVVGVDRNEKAIELAGAQSAENRWIDYVVGDFLGWDVPASMLGRADQILASYFLHEIFSVYGRSGYHHAINKCHTLLRTGGRLIVLDGVHPEPVAAQVRFRDGETREQFERFVGLYKLVRFAYRSLEDRTIEVDLGDFARFLNCLKFIVPANPGKYEASLRGITNENERAARAFFVLDYYTCPMQSYAPEFEQDFTFNSKSQWLKSLDAAGFDLEYVASFNERSTETYFWKSGIELLSPDRGFPEIHLCVVGRKR